jgi:hypothetical protein
MKGMVFSSVKSIQVPIIRLGGALTNNKYIKINDHR